jgi:hypothetical protein
MTSTDIDGSPLLILSQEEAQWLEEKLTTDDMNPFFEYNRRMEENILKKVNECLDSDQPK